MKTKTFFSIYILILLTGSYACRKLVEVGPPENRSVTETVFSDSAGASAAVIGLYTNLNPYVGLVFGNGAITIYTGLCSDELIVSNGSAEVSQFYSNSISVDNSINNGSLWNSAYTSIYQSNACIEGLAASSGISAPLKKQLTAEAKFVRAFIYFYLVNLYGDVPLVTSTDYKTNAKVPRTSSDSVYEQIIQDLVEANEGLSSAAGNKIRANKYTALCLLSRVYLYNKNWELAEKTASEIINSGFYSLETDLNNVFLIANTESVFQMPPYSSQGVETTEGYFLVPSDASSVPKYVINPDLLSAFETGDERKEKWLNKNTVTINGVAEDYYYPFKYKLGYDGNASPVENYIVFRVAEQYLIRAEARAYLNDLAGGLNDVNIIRNRAGLPNSDISTREALLDAIIHERQAEFFCEWGRRWFDLKRTGTIDAVLLTEKNSWKGEAALFPIPYPQIRTNPFLNQNPGY